MNRIRSLSSRGSQGAFHKEGDFQGVQCGDNLKG
jgi:hypothetical protein